MRELRRASKGRTLLPVPVEQIERCIYIVRGQPVVLDADLAELYGVSTRLLNQAVKRNRDRLPEDFAYQMTAQEFQNLKSQTATSSLIHGGRRTRPWVFTEQGVAMLSSVLRSPTAVRVNIELMRAFIRVQRLLSTSGKLVDQIQKLTKTVQLHDEQLTAITQVLQKLMEPPPYHGVTGGNQCGFS